MSFAGRSGPRTDLAWDRTALSAAGLGALLLKLGVGHDVPVESAAGAAALLLAATLTLGVRRRRLQPLQCDGWPSSGRSMAAAAVLTSCTAVLITIALLVVAHRTH